MPVFPTNKAHLCSIMGCNNRARKGFSPLCEKHLWRQRRQGDALQQTITQSALKPYITQVKRIIRKDKTGKLKLALEKHKAILIDLAEEITDAYAVPGKAMNYNKVQGARELIKIAHEVDSVELASVPAALLIMYHQAPGMFSTARGFMFQLVRRVRGLSESSIGRYTNTSGTSKRAIVELNPKTNLQMGEMLMTAYGKWMSAIYTQAQKEIRLKLEAHALVDEALESINNSRKKRVCDDPYAREMLAIEAEEELNSKRTTTNDEQNNQET